MSKRNSTVKIENGKVIFSEEIINYFENLRTEENSEWINKYFNVLSDERNLNAEKFEIHHIRPCFTFKDNVTLCMNNVPLLIRFLSGIANFYQKNREFTLKSVRLKQSYTTCYLLNTSALE